MKKRGFTLIELLVVIGIIAILAAIVIIAVNPGRQFQQARDAQRWSDVNALLNAIHQYAVDNNGDLPGIDADDNTVEIVGDGTSACPTTCTDAGVGAKATCLVLYTDLAGTGQTYLTEIPKDPSNGTDAMTGYYVNLLGSRRVEVGACDAEVESKISVTR